MTEPLKPPVAPHPSRLYTSHPQYTEILEAHRAALAAEEDGYIDPASGNWVFTSAFHLRRGGCCESGCRHCPYLGPYLVDEERRGTN